MSNDFNPYAPPQINVQVQQPKPRRLADLGKRFLGALVDGLAGMVFTIPGYVLFLVGGGGEQNPDFNATMGLGLLLLLGGGLVGFGIQVYLLATRSQSIGKYLMKTQIVDYRTGAPATLVQSLLMRMIVNALIGAIPCIGSIYSLADILFIFGEEHRCLHDQLAGTSVVDIS
jgi:uncharacterized RDD family membrane protein YckC